MELSKLMIMPNVTELSWHAVCSFSRFSKLFHLHQAILLRGRIRQADPDVGKLASCIAYAIRS